MTDPAAYEGVWVVLPTYNEAENLAPISAAIREALPAATLLVVDDGSPDGTGQIADELAAADDALFGVGLCRERLLRVAEPVWQQQEPRQ